MKKVGSVILKVNNLEVKDALGVTRIKGLNANFKNFAISGICGVTGNGQEEFMEALGGIIPVSVGSIRIYDQDVTHASVANRRKKGIGFIPADRKSKGIAQSASIQENTLAGFQHIISKRGLISSSQLKVHVNNILDEFKVSVEDQYLSASTLSGGNQQKLMFGREISHFPRVLVASQPTRGIDIGGSADLQNLLIEQRDKGVAVILQSEDLDELLLLSDEIFVFLAGRIVKYFERPFNKKQIGDAMVGFGNG
jgi:simple sugar transport system ATP-binding protein